MWIGGITGSMLTWIQYEFDRIYKLDEMWAWNSNQSREPDYGYGVKEVVIETSLDNVTWTALDNVPQFARATGKSNYVHNTSVAFGDTLAKYVKLNIQSNWSNGIIKQFSLSEVRFFQAPLGPSSPVLLMGRRT